VTKLKQERWRRKDQEREIGKKKCGASRQSSRGRRDLGKRDAIAEKKKPHKWRKRESCKVGGAGRLTSTLGGGREPRETKITCAAGE